MWALAAEAAGGAILESWWPRERAHFVEAGLKRARIDQAMTVLCELAPELARDRFVRRARDGLRHPIHGDTGDPGRLRMVRHRALLGRSGAARRHEREVDIQPIVSG